MLAEPPGVPYHLRRSPRLPRFDYATPGTYFVTVVTHRRRWLLGAIAADRSVPSPAGRMVTRVWNTIPAQNPDVFIEAFIVMPNHVHGILRLATNGGNARARLPPIVGAFKSLTTCQYIDGVRRQGWPRFEHRLWQRSYYDRVIRDEAELDAYREYIATNPHRWTLDREFPDGAW